MEGRAFDGVITGPLTGRSTKPRERGQTMIIDKGLGLTQTGDLLELAADFVDYIKFTFGTAALYPPALLRAKIALIRSHGVDVYPGGTFFEVALSQNKVDQYIHRCKDLGFNYIEVSDGTITMAPEARRQAIVRAREFGLQVVTEVGKKEAGSVLDPDEAVWQIRADLAAGAGKVIVEGRESGQNAGVYDAQGKIADAALDRIVAGAGDPGVLMWEAPLKAQQEELIIRFGPDVNLGNIPPDETLALEALRRGLRGDTLRLALGSPGGVVCESATGGD